MNTHKLLASGLLLSGIVIFSACKKDDAPRIDPRDAFVGKYEAEDCDDFEANLEIEKDAKNDKKIIIVSENLKEFYNLEEVEAEVAGNEFTFEEDYSYQIFGQTIEGELEGRGKLNGKDLKIDIKYTEDGDSDECDITGEKE
jgi:hypothetical protein